MKVRFCLMLGVITGCACLGAAAEPVNQTCPISGNAFDEPAATVEVNGHTVGFCCPDCVAPFEAWSAEKKASYVEASLKQDAAQPEAEAEIGNPYPLTTCPISGEKLGSMGDPIVKKYDEREVRYCCDGCPEAFEKDLDASWAKLDKKIIKAQTPYYPLETCVQCGSPISGEDAQPVEFVLRNRMIRTCSDDCKQAVLANPAPAWKTLDAAVKQAQGPHYPLDACAVSDEKLGEMGDPVDMVIGNRLVRLCCDGCKDKLVEDAPAVLAKIDAAWEKKYGEQWPDISIERVEPEPAAAGS